MVRVFFRFWQSITRCWGVVSASVWYALLVRVVISPFLFFEVGCSVWSGLRDG